MPMRVVVAGAIAHAPINGAGYAWVFLQYLLGFRQLGCEVLYVEHLDAKDCIDGAWQPTAFSSSINVAVFEALARRYGLAAVRRCCSAMVKRTPVCRVVRWRNGPTAPIYWSICPAAFTCATSSRRCAGACTSISTRASRRSGKRSTAPT
jgi:hypothetical protein